MGFAVRFLVWFAGFVVVVFLVVDVAVKRVDVRVVNTFRRFLVSGDFAEVVDDVARFGDVNGFVDFLEFLGKGFAGCKLVGFSVVRGVCERIVVLYVHGCGERGLGSVVDCVRVELERRGLAGLMKRIVVVCLDCGVADVGRLKRVDEVVGRVLAVLEPYLELLRGVEVFEDPDWGYTISIVIETSASNALKLNLELQEMLKGIPIVVRWTGPRDVSEDELVEYIARIVSVGGFKVKALKGFNSVEAVNDARGSNSEYQILINCVVRDG